MPDPICPKCGSAMVLKTTNKFRYPSGLPRRFWSCSKWPDCECCHGAHPDGKPFGVPADDETKKLRIAAHEVFDQLWKSRGMRRGDAYRCMQRMMGMTEDQAHIGMFNADQCRRLIGLLRLNGEE